MDSIPYHVQGNTIEFLQVSSGIAPLYPCRISTGISEGEGIAELINPDEPMATGRCNASWNSEHHMTMMRKKKHGHNGHKYHDLVSLGTFLAYENWHGGCLKRKSPGNGLEMAGAHRGYLPTSWAREFSNPQRKIEQEKDLFKKFWILNCHK